MHHGTYHSFYCAASAGRDGESRRETARWSSERRMGFGIGEEEDDEWRARLWSERKIRRCGGRRKGSPREELTKEEEG